MHNHIKVRTLEAGYAEIVKGKRPIGWVKRHSSYQLTTRRPDGYWNGRTVTWWEAEVLLFDEYGYEQGPLDLCRYFPSRREAVEAVLNYQGVAR